MELDKVQNTEEKDFDFLNAEEVDDNSNEEPTGSEEQKQEEKDPYDEVWESKDKVTYEDLIKFAEQENREQNNQKDFSEKIFTEDRSTKDNSWSLTITRPLKYRGKEFYPQTEDELIELAQKGLDYSFKMNKIRPYRELINFLEENGINSSDVIEMLKNNIGSNRTNQQDNFDFGDVEPTVQHNDTNFVIPKGHILEPILEHFAKIDSRLPRKIFETFEALPYDFKVEIINANALVGFANSVAKNEFDLLYPKAQEIKKQNPYMSWIEAYQMASKSFMKPTREVKNDEVDDIKSKKHQRTIKKQKTIEEQYDEIWNDENLNSIEDLERLLIEGV